MSGMRGSIPRRKPDPSRVPPPRPIIQKAPQHFFHDAGEVLLPGNGAVKIFETRMARAGRIESPSLSVSEVPVDATVWLEILNERSEKLFEFQLPGNGRHDFPTIPVVAHEKYSIWLAQRDGNQGITLRADIVFVFQEA